MTLRLRGDDEYCPIVELNRYSFYTIPELWTDHEYNGKKFPGDGYATFALTVLLPRQTPPLAIRIKEIV